MKYDDILVNYIGEFGKYQKIQFTLVLLPVMFVSMQGLSWTFTGITLPHRCWYPDENATYGSFDALSNTLNYSADKDTQMRRLQCYRFPNFTSPTELPANYPASLATTQCHEWKYDHSETTYSATNRWNIVCDRRWIQAMIQSMYYVGQAAGSLFFGYVGDQFGRKLAFVIAIGIQSVAGTIMAFSSWVEVFAILRMIVGFCHSGVYVVSIVIGIELIGPSKRHIGGIGASLFSSFGLILLGLLAPALRDYRYLQLIISAPHCIFVIYWWVVPESTRWLISRGRIEGANRNLRRAAKWNRGNLPNKWYEKLDVIKAGQLDRRYTYWDIFRHRLTRRRAIIQFFCWPVLDMVYAGLSMNPSFLGGNLYVAFVFTGLAEIPAIIFATLTLNKVGRKLLAVGGFATAGVMMMLTLVIPSDSVAIVTVCVIAAKMAITVVCAVECTWSSELFPTVIRSQTMGLCSMTARIGCVAASYISMLLVHYSKHAVALIFGMASLLAAILTVLQPETANAPLLETFEDAEAFGRNMSILSFKAPQSATLDRPDVPMASLRNEKDTA